MGTYWNEMKDHNLALKKRAIKQTKSQKFDIDGRKALNFKVMIMPNYVNIDKHEMKKHCIKMSDLLYIETFRLNNITKNLYYNNDFHAKIVIAYDANHRAWNNFDITKVNVSFYAYQYQNSTNDWRDSVSKWRIKNIKQDKQRYI